MTESQIRAEMQYRIQERLALMVGDMDVPPIGIADVATAEAVQWKRDYEAQTKANTAAD